MSFQHLNKVKETAKKLRSTTPPSLDDFKSRSLADSSSKEVEGKAKSISKSHSAGNLEVTRVTIKEGSQSDNSEAIQEQDQKDKSRVQKRKVSRIDNIRWSVKMDTSVQLIEDENTEDANQKPKSGTKRKDQIQTTSEKKPQLEKKRSWSELRTTMLNFKEKKEKEKKEQKKKENYTLRGVAYYQIGTEEEVLQKKLEISKLSETDEEKEIDRENLKLASERRGERDEELQPKSAEHKAVQFIEQPAEQCNTVKGDLEKPIERGSSINWLMSTEDQQAIEAKTAQPEIVETSKLVGRRGKGKGKEWEEEEEEEDDEEEEECEDEQLESTEETKEEMKPNKEFGVDGQDLNLASPQISRNVEHRVQVVRELVYTEKKYVKDLDIIVEVPPIIAFFTASFSF